MNWLQWFINLFRRPKPKPAPLPLPAPTDLAVALLDAHNEARRAAGEPPLHLDPQFQVVAAWRVRDLAVSGVLSHAGFASHMARSGFAYWATAENIDRGPSAPQSVVDAWLASPAHRVNVLGPYSHLGAAGAQAGSGTWFWCAVYGMPL